MIGSQKCGTSTTLTAFRNHPHVYMDDSELFQEHIPEGDLQRFRDPLLTKAAGKPIVGPMFPTFASKGSALPLKACFGPNLQLLMTVRDPVKRAISNYWMEVERNHEVRDIATAILDHDSALEEDFDYLKRGHYHRDIGRFLEHFPRKQLLITRLEDMAANTSAVLNTMVCWIGADPFPPDQDHARQRVGHYGNVTPSGVTSFLAEHYAESNRLLHEEYGVQIDDWTS